MRVGTRSFHNSICNSFQDHPHACGDKCHRKTLRRCLTGSSPCVWGQDTTSTPETTQTGIIPMRVGTRCSVCQQQKAHWDHPHACGDKNTGYSFGKHLHGSSPCVWGQEFTKGLTTKWIRIIPMRVGTSASGFASADVHKDHPHACGDKKRGCNTFASVSGSSPCVWGQDDDYFTMFGYAGIIPMRVGTRLC